MDSQFKVPSRQSDNITASNNLLDFDIPQGQYDLSKSYVQLKVLANGDGGASGGGSHAGAIFNVSAVVDVENADTSEYVSPIALVKNSRLTSDLKGRIEESRQTNELRLQLKNIFEPQSVYLGTQNTGLMSIKAYEQGGFVSPLIDVTAEQGTGTGKYLEKNIKIPVSEIVNIGKSKFFDTSRLGNCVLNMEMDLSRLSAKVLDTDIDYFDKDAGSLCNGVLKSDSGAGAKTSGVLGSGGGSTSKKYDEDYQEHIPFYVGQPVVLPAGAPGTAGGNGTIATSNITTSVNTIITDISYDETTGEVTLTFQDSLGTGATDAVYIRPGTNAEATTKSLTVNQANLVLYKVGSDNMPNPMPSEINYTVYSVENDSFSGNPTATKRQYEIEGEAVNALVTLGSHSNSIVSSRVYDDVRVSVNNELTTDRNVNSFTPLYYHKLNMFGLNMDKSVVNVAQKRYKNNSALAKANQDTGEQRGNQSTLSAIYEPLPASDKMKLVEFEINQANDGIQNISIFKELVRSV